MLNLAAPSKATLIRKLAELAGERLQADAVAIAAALFKREDLGSTGIGEGVAVPHSYLAEMTTPFCLFARLRKPIEFGSLDDMPVDLVFLFLKPEQHTSGLNLLACIGRRVRDEKTARHLRSVSDVAGAYQLLCGEEVEQ